MSPVWDKGRREQQVYLPAGTRWRDAWRPNDVYDGGRTITVRAALYQIPLFVRDGAPVTDVLGDLEAEWAESHEIAATPPDLGPLDAEVRAWFEQRTAVVPPPD